MGLFRNAASLLLTSAVSVPLGLGTSVVLARYLSLEDRGYFAVAASIGFVGVFAVQFGWPSAIIYRVRRVGTPPARALTTSLFAGAGFACIVVGIALLLRERIVDWLLKGVPPTVLYLALTMIPFQLMGIYLGGVSRAVDRFGYQNAYRLTLSGGRLLALTGALVVAGGALVAGLSAVLLVQVAATVGFVAVLVRHVGLERRSTASELLQTVRVGSRGWVQALAGNLHERIDVFMLAYLLQDHSQVALYSIAAGGIHYLQAIPEATAGAALPELAGLDRRRSGHLTAAALRHSLAHSLLAVIAAAAAAPVVLPLLYGADYAASVPAFLVLLLAIPLYTIYLVVTRYFYVIDRMRVAFAIQAFALPLNVLLNLWWIPSYGIVGAAGASLASYGAAGLLTLAGFRRLSGIPVLEVVLIRRSDLDPYKRRAEHALRRLRALRRSGERP
jgi:O-antigen/teichoic acid export membrane protein